MFKKLKIRLTLINLVLTSMVLIIIFSSIYTMMKNYMDNQVKVIMASVAMRERIASGVSMSLPLAGPIAGERRISNMCFFLKTDIGGIPFSASTNISISQKQATDVINAVNKKHATQGTMKYNSHEWTYLKVSKPYGFIYVFFDKAEDISNNVLKRLIIVSLMLGGASLLLVFAISLFLANRALIPIKNAWDKQKAFVADASHELRTPLAVMHTNMEIVLDNNTETIESQANWLENIQSEITRMTKLVEDLLFLARADSGEETISVSYFNLSSTLDQIADFFNQYAYEKGIILYSDIQHNVNYSGNEPRIQQLITILIDNAIKYTPENGYVRLGMSANETSIEITVADSGRGIPQEHLSKIFERFYKIDKSRSGSYGGSGLGLSIADTIIKEHKGTINVTSEEGQGSTFKVTLPRAC